MYWLQIILNGLVLGLLYALVALGLTLIFGILELVNFAHGELYMLGGYGAYVFLSILNVDFSIAIILVIVLSGLFGIILERLLFKPIRAQPHLNSLILSIGLALCLQTAVAGIFGVRGESVSSYFTGMVDIGGMLFPKEKVVLVSFCIFIIFVLIFFISRHKVGQAMRAVAQEKEGAALQGVNIDNIYTFTFAMGCALAGTSGFLIAPLYFLTPFLGTLFTIKAFTIIIIGGMGSIPGAIIAGIILGFVDSIGTALFSAPVAGMATFAFLIIILLVKPRGLMGYE
jgi:branched-chain amino acid transport system permease protein